MQEIHERCVTKEAASARLTLPFEIRQKSRFRAVLDDGREVALFLPRGTLLRGGDLLRTSEGVVVEVIAAAEEVSSVRSGDGPALLRAAYHLGNRHVPVQLGDGWLRYAHDHVLDAMLRQLGLEVHAEQTGFEPEGGAYGGHGHDHGSHREHPHTHE